MTNRSWKALLFDFDGTLAELNIDFSAMRADLVSLLYRYGVGPAATDHLPALELVAHAEAMLALRHPDRRDSFRAEAEQTIKTIELEAAGRGALFPQTRELLNQLGRRGIATAILTRNCGAAVRQVFPDIDDCCRVFLAREDTDRVKPDPEHLHHALKRLGLPARSAAMVGDHPLDMLSGQRSGTAAVGVLSGRSSREALLQAGADLIIVNAYQILDFLS